VPSLSYLASCGAEFAAGQPVGTVQRRAQRLRRSASFDAAGCASPGPAGLHRPCRTGCRPGTAGPGKSRSERRTSASATTPSAAASAKCYCGAGRLSTPAISEGGIVFDVAESVIELTEFIADAFDRGAYIGSKPLFAVAGHETRIADAVVNRAVGDIFPGTRHQQQYDLELGQRQVDIDPIPIGPGDYRC
jgi:hypothetical protein